MQKGNCPSGCNSSVKYIESPFNSKQDGVFYCDECGMYFWYDWNHPRFQKQTAEFWEKYINNRMQLYIYQNMPSSFRTKMKIWFQRIKGKVKNFVLRFFHVKILLKEKCYFSIPDYPYTLHIDSRETNHNIPHVHFYYGSGNNMPRSIAYKIDDLSPIGIEKNSHFKKKKFQKFLCLSKKWLVDKNNIDQKTGKEILELAWNQLKNK